MSWTDDEIDALFKEIPTQHKPSPFQDSFFDEIEHLLPKKRKNRRMFWVLGSALLTLTATVIYVYSDLTPDKTELAKSGNLDKTSNKESVKTQHAVSHQAVSPEKVSRKEASLENVSQEKATTVSTERPVKSRKTQPVLSRELNSQELAALEEQAKNEFALGVFTEEEAVKTQHAVSQTVASEKVFSEDVSPEENPSGTENTRPEFISPSITSGLSLLAVNFFNTDSEKQIQALYLPMLHRKHFLTLETGLGFTENFIKMENSSQRPMPTASLGLSYQYRTKGFFYSAGFNWMNFSPNSLNLTRESKVYGFETKHYSQNIDYQWITMVEMPLSVGKRFKNSSFTLGVSPAVVLGSMVDFTKTQNGEITQKSTIYGNMLGLKQYAASVNFAYDLHIARNLDLGVKVSNMLLNPLDETKFIGQLNKNPFQAQVTLKKHFRIR